MPVSFSPPISAATLPAPPPPALGRPWCLFLDVDGCLLDFVDDPAAVVVTPALRSLLHDLHDKLDGAMALVSGRTLDDLRRLFDDPPWALAGLHGLELQRSDGSRRDTLASDEDQKRMRSAVRALAAQLQGVQLEDKQAAMALHCRRSPDRQQQMQQMAEALIDTLPGYELQCGNQVVEFKPAGADKGAVVEELLSQPPFAGRAPIYLGDDLTDEYGFAIVNRHHGVSIRVGDRSPSTAQFTLPDPDAVQQWLSHALASLNHGAPMTSTPFPATEKPTSSLELGVIGNGRIAALIDAQARVVWCCLPRFDADATFCALLSPVLEGGDWSIELKDFERSEQHYLPNTAVLVTRLHDIHGGVVEITDFAPRYKSAGRVFHPLMLTRKLTPISGSPRIRVLLRPLCDYGAHKPETTSGSNHIRYRLDEVVQRMTSDIPVPMIQKALWFMLDRTTHMVFGPDETLSQSPADFTRVALESTIQYWREWVRYLSIPYEWQEAVIRAAITLKLCQYESTGAIVAALTTSIPEAAGTARNWDYRYCWLRDSTFTVRALNRLGATASMEAYIRYLVNLAIGEDEEVGPVFGISFERELPERQVEHLAGYRGMGPVRVGNDAWRQRQNDAYGSVVLASAQLFFDRRLEHRGDATTFRRLERMGYIALRMAEQPDAGLWEFRGRASVHTYSAAMCWAACDRLAHIATELGLDDRARYWHDEAVQLHERIEARTWNQRLGHFVDAYDGEHLDASLLLLADIGFVEASDPRFVATVDAIGQQLGRGHHLFRYIAPDDFGAPETSFNICTFWYIEALAATGRREQARAMFEHMLSKRTALGLLSEDLAPESGEHWGNYPQTYSMVGLIQAAMRLSRRWEDAL